MKKQRLFKLAAVALLVMGTLAAASCKKDESTTGGESTTSKVVKGMTVVKLYVNTTYKDLASGKVYTVNDSILQMFDINVEVIAGSDKKVGKLEGDSLILEAVTTTIPSNGQIKATATPKESFKADSTKRYTFGIVATKGFVTFYDNGTKLSNLNTELCYHAKLKGSRLATTDGLKEYAKECETYLGNGLTVEFKN